MPKLEYKVLGCPRRGNYTQHRTHPADPTTQHSNIRPDADEPEREVLQDRDSGECLPHQITCSTSRQHCTLDEAVVWNNVRGHITGGNP